MEINIKLRISNRDVDSLLSFMEGQECKFCHVETVSFKSKKPFEWLEDSRKKEFEDKLNMSDDGNEYKVIEISVTNTSQA